MIFIDRYKAMKCDFEDIHKAIDFWHDDYKGILKIYEMLGLTFFEYAMFVEDEVEFKKYLYDKHFKYKNDLFGTLSWDDDGIWILDVLKWHIQNGYEFGDLHFRMYFSDNEDSLMEDDEIDE